MKTSYQNKQHTMPRGVRIGVIGAGAFGTAIANLLSENNQVTLGIRKEAILDDDTPLLEHLQQHRENPKVLNGCRINRNLYVMEDYKAAVDKEMLIFILPVKYLRRAVRELNDRTKENLGTLIHKNTIIISGMKGIEVDTAKRPTEILMEELPWVDKKNFGVIAGATFAKEIIEGHNLSATVAMSDKKLAAETAARLSIRDRFNLHTSTDIVGTEILGALKNIVAIGSGYLSEAEKSEGARNTFIGKAFIETQKLVLFLGGQRATCFQDAGFPDFIMTANAGLSRNYSAGVHLAKHGRINYNNKIGTAEGVNTSIALYRLFNKMGQGFAKKHFKIFYEMYHVMHNGKQPKECFRDILSHYNADPEFSRFRETIELLRYRFWR